MDTDADLQKAVAAELDWDPAVKSTNIGVAVKNGVVTLSGHLDSYAEKSAASRAAKRVAGVKAVAVELEVKLSPDHKRSDTEIAESAELALKWNSVVPPDSIKLTVEQGWVTLQGEVEWEFERSSVEKAIRPLIGVVGISNLIALRPSLRPELLSRKIEDALTRQAIREAQRIRVDVEGSTVRLSGKVHSWHELEAARGVAWSVPGVRSVIDDLRIG